MVSMTIMEKDYYDEGDIVKEKGTDRLWEVVRYKQALGDSLKKIPTEYVMCRSVDDKTEYRTFHHKDIEFVRASDKPYIV